MKIGLLSDTHDQLPYLEQAVSIFNEQTVELVIHCGDWVSPFALKPFTALTCPLKSVFGNNDGDKYRHLQLAQKLGLDIQQEERFLHLELEGRVIAVFHGDYTQIVQALAKSGMYDAVFYGHNHTAKIERVNETLLVNPGGFVPVFEGFQGPSVAIYETAEHTAKHIFLDT